MEAEKVREKERTVYGKEIEDWEPNIRRYPALPSEALCGIAGEFVALACENSEADPAAVLATFLVRWGVEIGRGPYLQLGDAEHRAIENAVIVGASSKSRKGTSARPVERLFREIGRLEDWAPCKTSPGPLSSGEGLIYAVRDEQEEWKIDRKGNGRWIVKDPGVEDKRLFVLDEEFAAALASTRREGNTLSAIIRRLFDAGDIEPLTKTSRTKATGAHIGILTHITTGELEKALVENEMLNGFGNRFLWVCARRQGHVPFPVPMPAHRLKVVQEKIIASIPKAAVGGRCDLDPGARDLWFSVYPTLSREHPGLVGCLVNRAEAHVMRLALLYATLDGQGSISATHLESALAFWSYCEQSAKFIFGGRESDGVSDKIVETLRTGPKSSTELYGATGRNYSKDRMNVSVTNLIASGKIRTYEEKTGKGRPKIMFCLSELNEFNELITSKEPTGGLHSLNSSVSYKSEEKNERVEVRI